MYKSIVRASQESGLGLNQELDRSGEGISRLMVLKWI
jgi:hypothetical protein